jgi:hypothetical protein
MISIEEAKDKLADYNVLLKYMSFLQSNGFSDCGRGQIIGQIALIQEYLIEEYGDVQKQDNGLAKGIIDEKEKQIVADITYEAGRISISQENASNVNKPKDLKQFIKVEYNERNIVKNNEVPIQKGQGIIIQSSTGIPPTTTTAEDNKIISSTEGENKLIKQSWRDMTKRMADVEDW